MPWKEWWGSKIWCLILVVLFFSPLQGEELSSKEENATLLQESIEESGNFSSESSSIKENTSLDIEKNNIEEKGFLSSEEKESIFSEKKSLEKSSSEENVFTLFPEDPQFLYESRYIPDMPSSLTPLEEVYSIERKEEERKESPSFVSLQERKEEDSFFSSPLFLEKILPLGILLFLFGLFVLVRSYAQRRKAL